MAIIVNRFRVRHNGKAYGPGQPAGQVITGLSEKEEAHMIAGSNGSIEKYAPPKLVDDNKGKEAKPVGKELEDKKPLGEQTGQGENSEGGSESGDDSPDENDHDSETETVFSVDPGELIKPGNPKDKGGK